MRSNFHLGALLVLAALAPCCGPNGAPVTIPLAPTGLTVTSISTSQIRLDWTDAATNESSYVILRSLDGGTYIQIATLPADSTTYTDFGLQPSLFYFYRVQAVNGAGASTPVEDVNTTQDLIWNGPTTGGPLAREFHSAVYDEVGQRMLLFGGAAPGLRQDLYELTLPDPGLPSPAGDPVWNLLSIAGPPSPRAGHSAVFDNVNNRMIVFGGQTAGGLVAEVWVLSFVGTPAWTPITGGNLLGTLPPVRRNHKASFDPIRREMIVFGGADGGGQFLGGTYVLSIPTAPPFTWSTPGAAGTQPVARQSHSAIHDPLGPRTIIFGGHDNDTTNGNAPGGGDGSALNGETWSLSPTTGYGWSLITGSTSPSMRLGHSAVYDSLNRRMVLFGGGDETFEALNPEMWALNLTTQTNWSLLATSGGPSGVFYHSAVYDALYHRMVIFGGRSTSLPVTLNNDLWWIAQ